MKTLVLSAAIAASAGAASAATTYYGGTNGNILNPSNPFTVSAGYVSPTGTGAATVTVNQNGLGVQSPWEAAGSSGAATIDGNPLLTTEYLTVSFDYAVKLDSFTLGAIDSNDEYSLLVNTTTGSQLSFSSLATNPVNVNYVTSFTIFAIGTPLKDGGARGFDDFRLEDFTISAVPLPAGAGLLLGGLGLLGFARRRRA